MKKMSLNKSIFTAVLMLMLTLVLVACGEVSDEKLVAKAIKTLEVGFAAGDSKGAVTKDVTLVSTIDDITVTWVTSNTEIISELGVVTVRNKEQQVKLTASLTLNEVTDTKEFDLVVSKSTDAIQPAFMGAVNGKLPEIKHLATQEVDLLDGVRARDNVDQFNVEITIDKNGYDKDVAGTYELTYFATDKVGNQASINRTVIVEAALDVTLNAAVIGDSWVEFDLNNTNAFINGGTFGANFRQSDKLFVMDKAFFNAEVAEHGAEYPTNNNLPVFPYGSLIITDKDFNVIHFRFQTGVFIQLDVVDGQTVLTHTDVSWNTGIAGGNMFYGVSDLIPEGGYVMFAASPDPQKTRIFLVSNLFYSKYTGGAVSKDPQDVFDLTQIELTLEEDYRVLIALPDALETPEIELNRHTLSWTANANAISYQILVDGVVFMDTTLTQIDLSALDLELSQNDGYSITVKAITKDVFKYSSSEVSNAVNYKKIEIQPLSAPEIAVSETDANVITWAAVEGTDYYEVYAFVGSLVELVGTTDALSFNVSDFTKFNGVNGYMVKGIGLATHSDSLNSNVVNIDQTVTTTMTIGGMDTEVVVMTAREYFARRNLVNANKLGAFIYLVTDLNTVTEWNSTNNEAFSTVVVLNSNYQAKVVRNILAKQTYTTEKGWFADETYANNGLQTVGFANYVSEGDMLLIGKNGLTINYVNEGVAKTAAARDFVAYHYVNRWADLTKTPASGGWRDALNANYNSSTTVLTIKK